MKIPGSFPPPSIVSVNSAVPAFAGYTQKAIHNGADCTLLPVAIQSMAEFEQYFGLPETASNIEIVLSKAAVTGSHIQVHFAVGKSSSLYNMYYALQLFFANGGQQCFIVSVGATAAGVIDAEQLKKGLDALQLEPSVTLIVFPEAVQALSDAAYGKLLASALSQCAASGNRFLIADVKTDAGKSVADNAAVFRNMMQPQPDALKYGAAYFPYLQTNIPYRFKEAAVAVTDQRTGTVTTTTLSALKTTDTLLYSQVIAALKNFCAVLPPSAAVAAIYTVVDNSRGVWKAPANISLSNVNGVAVPITDIESGSLNIDVTGISINALRTFAGKGILVWGARTMDGNSQEWRYVSVRRFISTVQNSVKLALGSFAFELNNSNTWTTVKSMVSNYLTQLWRQGALMGAKPGAAFFVNIGLGITMTQADVDNGLLIVQTGMAVLRPAEFIIITIVQKIQPV